MHGADVGLLGLAIAGHRVRAVVVRSPMTALDDGCPADAEREPRDEHCDERGDAEAAPGGDGLRDLKGLVHCVLQLRNHMPEGALPPAAGVAAPPPEDERALAAIPADPGTVPPAIAALPSAAGASRLSSRWAMATPCA